MHDFEEKNEDPSSYFSDFGAFGGDCLFLDGFNGFTGYGTG
jgi:hypothetical protein